MAGSPARAWAGPAEIHEKAKKKDPKFRVPNIGPGPGGHGGRTAVAALVSRGREALRAGSPCKAGAQREPTVRVPT